MTSAARPGSRARPGIVQHRGGVAAHHRGVGRPVPHRDDQPARLRRTAERRTPGDTSILHEADIVEAVLRRAGRGVHLVGHSFGGLALAVAIRGHAELASPTRHPLRVCCGSTESTNTTGRSARCRTRIMRPSLAGTRKRSPL